jgi:hypothetical protein
MFYIINCDPQIKHDLHFSCDTQDNVHFNCHPQKSLNSTFIM